MKLIKKNKNFLVEIPPGRYVRTGGRGDAFKDIAETCQGLVVEQSKPGVAGLEHLTVLVEGDLINYWSSQDAE